jgi:GNAT superfamily N-acetyltransferase
MDDVEIRRGYLPGPIGRVVELHAAYYHAQWGFGAFFEAQVAGGLAEFFGRYDAARHAFWVACLGGRVVGSITIDGAHARTAVDFCRANRYPRVYLWTFAGLEAARHLYEKVGFQLVARRRGQQWGTEVTEQRFELDLTTESA